MLESLFIKVLMVCNFFKKENSGLGVFLQVFRKNKKTYFVEHVWTDTWVRWTKKKFIHKIYLRRNTGDGVLFSAVAGMLAYSFSKKWLHHRSFSMKIGKFYITSILQNNAARLLLISCDILNVLFTCFISDKSVQS